MSFYDNAAGEILKRIASHWRAEPSRIRWTAASDLDSDGFDFWPGDYLVRVRAHRSNDQAIAAGVVTTDEIRMVVTTDYLSDIPIDNPLFTALTAGLTSHSTSCFGWYYPPKAFWQRFEQSKSKPALRLGGTYYINSENMNWMTEVVAATGIVQPISAQIQADLMPELLRGGTPERYRPERAEPNGASDNLEDFEFSYLDNGKKPSRFAKTGEFEMFAAEYAKSDICFGNGDGFGLTLETPFGRDSALIKLETRQPHPHWGHGLLVTMQLPMFYPLDVTIDQAAELNFLEFLLWTGFPLMGCWHNARSRGGQEGVAFTQFLPNAVYKPGLATQSAFWFLERARWVRQTKFPDMKDLTMAQILKDRFGRL
jgi:hypothetical protein